MQVQRADADDDGGVPARYLHGSGHYREPFYALRPCAEELYTRGIPLFSMLVPLGWSVLSNAVYAAFILLTGRDVSNISDMLVMTALFGGIFALGGCIVMCIRFAALFFVVFYAPFFLVMITVSSSANEYGYGLPLWTSALICCGSFLAAIRYRTYYIHHRLQKGKFPGKLLRLGQAFNVRLRRKRNIHTIFTNATS